MPEVAGVTREVRVKARPEVVFSFFTDPAKMILWKGTEAMLDPRPGGAYRVNVTGRDVVLGEYLEIVPYSKIVFTWGWLGQTIPVAPGSSTVEVTLTPDGDGTLLRLTHSGLAQEMQEEHLRGWDHYLARLIEAAEGRDPGIDPNTRQGTSNMQQATRAEGDETGRRR